MIDHQYLEKKINAPQQKKETPSTPTITPADTHAADALDLQHKVGNRSAQRLLAQRKTGTGRAPSLFIQTKLTVGPANDQFEQEADRVAQQVVNTPQPVQRAGEEDELQLKRADIQREGEEDELQMKRADIQREGEEDELQLKRADIQREGEEDELQMKRADIQREGEEDELQLKRADIQREGEEDELQLKGDPRDSFEVDGSIEDRIMSQKGGGQPLPEQTRNQLESGFGYDFSGVQVHTGPEANTLNRSLSAKAFTTGQDIFFADGQYKPDSKDGQELIAHELTHVVQQGGANVQKKTAQDE